MCTTRMGSGTVEGSSDVDEQVTDEDVEDTVVGGGNARALGDEDEKVAEGKVEDDIVDYDNEYISIATFPLRVTLLSL